jgi:hypothetical protein
MATITTPAAGVSPYQEAAAAPTVLRAGADGTTVLASAAAAAATVTELAAANANTLVVVNGQAALNNLITTSQPGVFDGANVTINLEEQNFNTTNQVTSTINSPSGSTGEIQYNSGTNSFASDAYFTYTDSNVVTPGIRTNNYLYANGAPFTGGGNAAIGNFVFSGDTMTISDANQVMSITGNGTGNVNVTANSNVWVFNNVGNLILPSNTSGINYANGSPYGGGNYSNSNVSSFLAAFGSNVVSTTGNITGGNLTTTGTANVASLAVTGSVTVQGSIGVSSWITVSSYLSANGNILTGNNVSAAGNITGNFFFGNGSQLTGVVSSYGNANVIANLAALGSNPVSTTGNVTGGNLLFGTGIVSGTGNISGNYFIGNGSQLTGISSSATLPLANGTSNINIATANGNVTVTANSNTWTFNTDGNLTLPTAGNIVGAVNIIGNGAGNVNVNANGRAWTFAADGNLVLPLAGNIVNYGNTWNFGLDGNLTLPGNIIAINYANGNRVTGNVTFRDEIVIGTGTSNLISGLYLAPSSSSANANMYLRVRGNINDEPTHIHFDTGNNAYYNQFIGDDNKYIQLANTGNIVINSNDVAGNSAQWTFDYDGNLTLPADATISDFGDTASLNVDGSGRVAQLYWNGNIGNGNPDNGGDYYTWAYVASGGFFIQHENVATSTDNLWGFGIDGNLTLPTGTPSINYANGSPYGGSGAGLPLANGISNINIATANGNVTITANGSPTWTFGTNNILTLPGNSRVAPVGANIEIQAAAGGYAEIVTSDGNSYVAVTTSGAEIVTSGAYTWAFNNVGTLTTPGVSGNITGANVITANVFAMTHGGNITEGTIPAYTSLTGNTIVLTPSSGTSADQQLVIYPTANIGDGNHLHLTSGNLYNTELFLGDDFLYVKLANTGNIVINSNDNVGNSAQWTFDTGGMLIFPTGNLIITPDYAAFGNAAVISSADHNLITGSFGGNGGTSSLWVEDVANIGTSNIAAVYANPVPGSGNVRIAVGTNGGPGPNLWDFQPNGNLTAPGNIITTGNITGSYFFGNGSQLTDVGAASVPGQNILPTIQTITVADTSGVGNSGGGGLGYANVTVANITPVTEYGVIITSGTSSQKYATGALGSIPGTVKLSFTTGLNSTPFTVYAYVTSNAGTYYSNSATGTSGICLLAGTQIALSDGTHKAIEHITYTDKLLSWDFDRGCYAETTALWIKRGETGSQYNLLTFSDGTTLRTFDQHRIFNKQAGAFTYPMTDATPIGTVTVNKHGQEIILTNKQVIQDTIEYYNVITDYHMNLFSDSVLTSCRFNNIYPITDMKFVKDGRTLRTRAEFKNVEDRFFHGLRLAEQTADIKTVEWYVDRLLSTEVSTQSELAS